MQRCRIEIESYPEFVPPERPDTLRTSSEERRIHSPDQRFRILVRRQRNATVPPSTAASPTVNSFARGKLVEMSLREDQSINVACDSTGAIGVLAILMQTTFSERERERKEEASLLIRTDTRLSTHQDPDNPLDSSRMVPDRQ